MISENGTLFAKKQLWETFYPTKMSSKLLQMWSMFLEAQYGQLKFQFFIVTYWHVKWSLCWYYCSYRNCGWSRSRHMMLLPSPSAEISLIKCRFSSQIHLNAELTQSVDRYVIFQKSSIEVLYMYQNVDINSDISLKWYCWSEDNLFRLQSQDT